VTVEHGTLTITAERAPGYGDTEHVIAAERPQGPFTRQLSLGEGVDSDHLTAEYGDGVLRVTIPAAPKAQARRIEITHAPARKRTVAGSAVKKLAGHVQGQGRSKLRSGSAGKPALPAARSRSQPRGPAG